MTFARAGHSRCSSGIRGLSLNYVVNQDSSDAELYIDRGEQAENKRIFDRLLAQRASAEKAFGNELI
jgi:hypothetical protein